MRNDQVKVDFDGHLCAPEGICRFPGCSNKAVLPVSDGRYTNHESPEGNLLVCLDHYCVCPRAKRDLYGIVPIVLGPEEIQWWAIAHFVHCDRCQKLVMLRPGESVGQSSITGARMAITISRGADRH